ncbi:site-specific integrase [Pseudomonas sp. N3-W]|uniref:site-specific integrase n=1 Tax=Pseudomonas sp. N3-W TaxID=2975049 RepID=UPI00217ECFE1|nr:site-specific integrase [Pseudomonas sp. N3-W]UWF47870.1 site-specific integrase [Pseudomonas sp. N3-W]
MSNIYYFLGKDSYLGRNVFKCLRVLASGMTSSSLSFQLLMYEMVNQGQKYNSIKSYAYKCTVFLDYLTVGLSLFPCADLRSYTILARLYHSYLTQGLNSMSATVQEIAQRRTSPMINISTSLIHHAAIEKLIDACHEYCIETNELHGKDVTNREVYFLSKLYSIGVPRSDQELKMLNEIYGRPTKKSRHSRRLRIFSHLPKVNRNNDPYDHGKFFPLDKIGELIRAATSYRDATLWALIAATSLRASEALQVLWEDVSTVAGEIYAVEPANRVNYNDAYIGLTTSQLDKLSWKGRQTKYTLLLEPYGKMFFEYLELYLRYEYQASAGHNFIFQSKNGYPLCFCDYGSVLLDPFVSAAEKVLGCKPDNYRLKLHSLRHSYCVYMKNFVEHTHGVGLSDYEIMALTGHADPKSAARYAVVDLQLLNEKLSLAFQDSKLNINRDVHQLLIGFHERRIVFLKQKIAEEKAAEEAKGGAHSDD